MPRYEYTDEKSNKFWEIELEGSSHTVRYGRIGSDGQVKTKGFADAATARKDYDKMIASKLKKGYELVGEKNEPTTAVETADNRDLEAALHADPTDDEAWAVYADWLQSQGDPRGELAAVQVALAGEPTEASAQQLKREAALLEEHRGRFVPAELTEQLEHHKKNEPDSKKKWHRSSWHRGRVEVSWHAGFWRSVRLARAHDGYPVALEDLVKAVLDHGSARFLQELTIGSMGEYPFEYDNISKLIASTKLPCLRKLSYAEFSRDDTELSWSQLGDVSGQWTAAPHLEEVRLHGGSFTLGAIDLPRAHSFTAYTGGLSGESIKSICAAAWPALTKLELLFGADDYGAEGTIEDIAAILAGTSFPALTDLGLRNSEFADDIAEALPKSPIARRIARLDLSLGVLTKEGAEALAAGAGAFEKLEALDVEDNYIDDEAASVLTAAFPFVHIGDQDKLDDLEEEEDDDDVWRYVTVGE